MTQPARKPNVQLPLARGTPSAGHPTAPKDRDSRSVLRAMAGGELVFAVVGHVGSGTSYVANLLQNVLQNSDLLGGAFEVYVLKARDEIAEWARTNSKELPAEGAKDLDSVIALQDLGDEMRKADHAAVARAIALRIREKRATSMGGPVPTDDELVMPDGKRRAYIVDSIRHPAEVHLLRSIYRNAFTLVGIVCHEDERLKRIRLKYTDAGTTDAMTFMRRDEKSPQKHGQRVSEAFYLSDAFLDNSVPRTVDNHANPAWQVSEQLERLARILTHREIVRPTTAETAMVVAYGARARSACLSRQVGAALVDSQGNVVATGTNEVPRAGGGVYGQGHGSDESANEAYFDSRCAYQEDSYCHNTKTRDEIIEDLLQELPALAVNRQQSIAKLRDSRIGALLEFSRAVHAEMDALLSSARTGAGTVGTSLFVTTFPCHYCARHIVAAGVHEVQYVEPYPKSRAFDLHSDSITRDAAKGIASDPAHGKVVFKAFTGVAPRMYARAFEKDRDLKAEDGTQNFGEPDWGDAWELSKVSYVQLEVELSRRGP
jgi:deoxycytidylate deaminase